MNGSFITWRGRVSCFVGDARVCTWGWFLHKPVRGQYVDLGVVLSSSGRKHWLLVSTQIWSFTEVVRAAPFTASSRGCWAWGCCQGNGLWRKQSQQRGCLRCPAVCLSVCLLHLQPCTWYTTVIPLLHCPCLWFPSRAGVSF